MKLQDIAQTAVLVSSRGRWYVDEALTPPDAAVAEWWSLARKRQMALMQALDQVLADLRMQPADAVPPLTRHSAQAAACVAEALVTDMLLRVCLAVVSANEQSRDRQTNHLVVRGIFLGQLQVRQRLLQLLADGRMWQPEELVLLDRIRRRCERWTDVLLGHLACRHRVDEFAFDPRRARDFGWTQLSLADRPPLSAIWQLIAAGTRLSFPDTLELPEASAAWHRRFASSVQLMLAQSNGGSYESGESGVPLDHFHRLNASRSDLMN